MRLSQLCASTRRCSRPLLPKLLSRDYDPAFVPMDEKTSITIGMGMTEKQGGTDVRANITQAVPLGSGRALRHHRA